MWSADESWKAPVDFLTYSFRKYLLSACPTPWAILDTIDTVTKRTYKVSALKEPTFFSRQHYSKNSRYGWSSSLQMVLMKMNTISLLLQKFVLPTIEVQKQASRNESYPGSKTLWVCSCTWIPVLQIYWGLIIRVKSPAFFLLFVRKLCNLFSEVGILGTWDKELIMIMLGQQA